MAIRSLERDLGRCQFQGDAAARFAHRPAGRSVCRHVWRPARIQGPGLRLHDGDRIDAGAAAGAERHRQFRQGGAAAAGPDRARRIRPGARTRCSSALPSFPTSTSTSRRPDPMPGSFCRPRVPNRGHRRFARHRPVPTNDGRGLSPRQIACGRRTLGWWPPSWWCRPSWRCSTPPSRWWRCAISPAACRRRSMTANGFSPATLPPTPSSCRSPAG